MTKMYYSSFFSRVKLLIVLTAFFVGFAAHAEELDRLVLVNEGDSPAPVVVFENAPPKTLRAAEELAYYIEKTSGAAPEVIEGRPDPLPNKAIWVGYQPVIEELFPELDFDFEHPEEILISANEEHLVIAGRDVWNPDHLEIPIRWGGTITGRQLEYGTINAVYTFLQDYLGVRWLWPGELGEDILKQETIAFAPFTYRYHPQFRFRNEIFYFASLYRGRGSITETGKWNRLNRLQLDSLYMRAGGHGFNTWWERFHETNPEFFALQPDGSRGGGDAPYPSAGSIKMCKSNPAVWEQWLKDVEEKLKEDPNRTVFNAAAGDAAALGRCVCADCRAWDNLDGKPRRLSWRGLSQEYVAMSDREVTFANQLGRLLKERYPDEDYYVMIHSYGPSRPAPVEAVPDDNVIISIVANSFARPEATDRASLEDALLRDQIKAWAEVTPNWFWRPNVGDAFGRWRGLPDIDLRQAVDDYRFVADLGAIGAFSALPHHWANLGPVYYLIARLAWNPYIDEQSVMEDYYQRGFGPAAENIAAYWALMEKTRERLGDEDGEQYPTIYDAYDQGLLDQAYGYLDRAAQAVEDDSIYEKRVEFVRAGLDYTRLIVDAHAQMKVVRESEGEEKEAAAERARSNWEAIEQINNDFPHALTWHWIRPEGRRMSALHPDH